MSITWDQVLARMPLIAILRGVRPSEVVGIAQALFDGGIICAEIPLNSPDPFDSIAAARKAFDDRMLIGAGTVLSVDDAERTAAAGGQFIVSPNTDAIVIAAAKRLGLHAIPGFFTATEAFAAIAAGADALKLFPADQAGPAYVKALRAVLPAQPPTLAVGGVSQAHMARYLASGAIGFGLGSALYEPGDAPATVLTRARAMVRAFHEAKP